MESRYHDKECAICGKVFTPMTANQRYCSPECREVSRKNMAKEYTKIFWDEVKAEDEIARIIENEIGFTLAKEIGKYAEMHTEVDRLNETFDVVGMVKVMVREEL